MKKKTEEVKVVRKPGELSPITVAFIEWFNSLLTEEVGFYFDDAKKASNFLTSIRKYVKKHEYAADVIKADDWTVVVSRKDGKAKYNGFVRFTVKGDDILFHRAVAIKKAK